MLRFQRPLTLVDSLPAGEQLTVVGDGPLRTAVTRAASQDIHVIGSQQRSSVDQYLRSSEGLIFPSRHYETQGLVYLEALRAGTPTVARDGNAVAAAVREERSGSTYERDDEIVRALQGVRADAPELRSRCLQTFEQRYSESVWRTRRYAEYSDLLTTSFAH